jgi:hypothetical protein
MITPVTETIDRIAREGRVIVVPRPLAEHFRDRLTRLYAGRDDVRIVVDRRMGQRRRSADRPPAADRRRGERRDTASSWSLSEMPSRSAGDPAAAGARAR